MERRHRSLVLDADIFWAGGTILLLTNRELATAIWIMVIIAAAIAVPRARIFLAGPLQGVLTAVTRPKVLGVFGIFFVWCAFIICLATHLRVWNLSLLKDSIIIAAVVGIPRLFKSVGQNSGTVILRDVVWDVFRPTAILAFYLNLESLPLWAEIIAIPLFSSLAILHATTGKKLEWKQAQGCIGILLGVLGVGLLVWTVILTIQQLGQTDWMAALMGFALSIWLPLIMFPYLYAAAFYAASETDLTMLRFTNGAPKRVQLAAFLGLHFSLKWAAAFRGNEYPVGRLKTFRDARQAMRNFRVGIKRDAQLDRERIQRLHDRVGLSGADADGVQLDRREFQVTKKILSWIAVTQMGRYENNGNRYWDDLTDTMVDARKNCLPDDHGFVTQVTPDGQKWRTWRQLPNRWYLAMGGANDLRHDFYYQGDRPPIGWPLSDRGQWASDLDPGLPTDWAYNDGSVM